MSALPLERTALPGRVVRSRRAGVSLRVDVRAATVCLGLAAAIALVGAVSIGSGDYPLSVDRVLRTLLGHGTGIERFIVVTLRLPRVLTALLVGGALGLSGAIFQSLARNPLGSPDIIGFTSGAATGAVFEILVLGGGLAQVAGGAIVGGLVTAAAVYLLAFKRGVQGYRLVLVGIGVGAMLESVTSYLLLRATLEQAEDATVWLVGSLNGDGWEHVRPIALALAVLVPAALALGGRLALLELGDDAAKGLGVRVERTRLLLILTAVGLAAVATAAAGPIAFVALSAPQLARRLTRSPGPGLLAAGLMGALLLEASDLAAQRLFGATQLPVGVVTGAAGGLYLAWLLSRDWRQARA